MASDKLLAFPLAAVYCSVKWAELSGKAMHICRLGGVAAHELERGNEGEPCLSSSLCLRLSFQFTVQESSRNTQLSCWTVHGVDAQTLTHQP